jgi:tetratricopeptide (TPR) repeat protein
MRVRVGLAVLCYLLSVLPVAAAAEGEGSFVIRDSVVAPLGAQLEGSEPLAFFAGSTAKVEAFTMTLPEAKVRVFEQRFQNVAGVRLASPAMERIWTVKDATVQLVRGGDHSGFFGLYPSPGGTLALQPSTQPETEPRSASKLGDLEASTTDWPGASHYTQSVSGPHMLTTAQGSATFIGKGAVKVNGMDFEIRQEGGNRTAHVTGSHKVSMTEDATTWVYLEWEKPGTLTVRVPSMLQAATGDLSITKADVLRFTPLKGELRTSNGTYLANGTPASVAGDFRAVLAPLPAGYTAQLDLSGDMEPSAAFVRVPASSPLAERAASWWGLALIVGAVVGVGAVVVTRKRRRGVVAPMPRKAAAWMPRPLREMTRWQRRERAARVLASSRSPLLEVTERALATYFEAIEIAEKGQDTQTAYDLTHAARRALEKLTSEPEGREDPYLVGDLLLQEGEYLLVLGEPRKAYAAFERAAPLVRPYNHERGAEADYGAAVAFVRSGGSHDKALGFLAAALDAHPALVVDAVKEGAFAPLRGSSDYEAAVSRAEAAVRDMQAAGDAVGV